MHNQGELGHTPDNVSSSQASTLGTGLITAGVALFRTLGLELETLEQREREETRSKYRPWILIWGGAGITGLYLIQLTHVLGFKIVCAASPVNHAYVRSLGADVVLDRWLDHKKLVEQVRAATDDNVSVRIEKRLRFRRKDLIHSARRRYQSLSTMLERLLLHSVTKSLKALHLGKRNEMAFASANPLGSLLSLGSPKRSKPTQMRPG